jgi:hypothetical protein
MSTFTKSVIERIAIDWLEIPGCEYAFGSGTAPNGFFYTLARLRDNLLPRLMRGEVCVKDVEFQK